jgi:hypothetical protein
VQRRPPARRNSAVSKSPLVIGAIGLGGCLLLGLLMKQAVQQQQAERTAPRVGALAAQFGARLVGPLALREEIEGELRRAVVHGRAAAGQDRRELAAEIGAAAWALFDARTLPDELRVTLRAEDRDEAVSRTVPRPAPDGARPAR